MKDIEAFEKSRIENFLKDPDRKKVVIPYRGKRLNAACDWWKLRNNSVALSRALLSEILRKAPPYSSLKSPLYRLMGVKIGKDVFIAPDVLLDPFYPELITIENGVTLGWGCRIAAHEFVNGEFRLGRVHIGKKTVIGAWSTVRMGVTIGDGAIVSMKSFVNKDVADGKTVGGVPAEEIIIKNIVSG